MADRLRRPNGEEFTCDRALLVQLTVAARKLGYEPTVAPLVTTDHVVTGAERQEWAARGYAAVDMESGLIVAPRVGALRVILDTPQNELSAAWLHPKRAVLNPFLWPQAVWLARNSAPCAKIAARIVAFAFAA